MSIQDSIGLNDLRWRKNAERESLREFRNESKANYLLKPDKVKHFQEKERNILEQSLARPSSQDVSNSFGLSNSFSFPTQNGKTDRLWLATNSTNIHDQYLEGNNASLSSETLWKKHDEFSQYRLPPTPTSALKKKGSTCSSTKRQRGKLRIFSHFTKQLHIIYTS